MFEVREAESADIMQYYPMFTPSPVFMSTIVAHFKRVCRHRTPTFHAPPATCASTEMPFKADTVLPLTAVAQDRAARTPCDCRSSHTSPPAFRRRGRFAALAGMTPALNPAIDTRHPVAHASMRATLF